MPRRCCVEGCRSYTLPYSMPTFIFPKNEVIRDKWIQALGRKNWTPSKYSAICLQHFRPEDVQDKLMIQNEKTGYDLVRSKLFNGAIPSIFPGRPHPKEMALKKKTEQQRNEEKKMENEEVFCLACNFVNETEKPKRKFQILPQCKERRVTWLRKLNRCDLIGKNISSGYRVCEIHFPKNSLRKTGKKLIDVVPIEVLNTKCSAQQNVFDSKILQEVKKEPESFQTANSCNTQISKIQAENTNEILKKNEYSFDIEEGSKKIETDPLIPIKEEIEATPYRIEENLNLPTTFPVGDLKACEPTQDLAIKIEIESLDDLFQTNECLVNVNNPIVANEIDPLISVKDEIEEKPNLPEGENVETSSKHNEGSQKVYSPQQNKGEKSTANTIQQNITASSNGGKRKRRRSHEEEKNVDCENCKKLKKENDFYKEEYVSKKEKCSQILERVKICADAIESIVQNNKILNDLSTRKLKLVERVREYNINLLKQIETLKTEIHIFNCKHCSLIVSTIDN
ncbi:uncharacterized protein LOC129618451 isoform X1 [Condylostylus longicornis]|uniref:uncharacterized protein LOC129618451 isoform X1 n=1 Tax=Condylostylus longicornis TaxID=2530218 RepID=UPI00244DBF3B|nr:uncharacterized protein LOC129618451 isoform X1 [Condylostylus longicornis]XP_055389175.1 uncharacterized protein LOC129618451 isoform X1 [Condylostylus longicornis]